MNERASGKTHQHKDHECRGREQPGHRAQAPDDRRGHDQVHDHDHACDHGHEHDPGLGAIDVTALISVRRLRFARGGRQILQDVDLDLHNGEIVTLIGPNGAGKTTLVRMMLGLQKPDDGVLRRKKGLTIGYVPQRFDLDQAIPLTVERFLTLGFAAVSSETTTGACRDWSMLSLLGGLRPALSRSRTAISQLLAEVGAQGLEDRQLAKLSGGELQRVVLARALSRNPDLLVLDEPVRGVDFAGEAALYELIGRLRDERSLGILLVSHDLHIVMAQSDRVICLNGHICCSGVPDSVAQHPEYARLFGRQAASALGLYRHDHDHSHDLSGAAIAKPARSRDSAGGDVNNQGAGTYQGDRKRHGDKT